MKDGSCANGEEARQARWTEHFAEVLGGSVVCEEDLTPCAPLTTSPSSIIRSDSPNVEKSLARLRDGKGIGRDGPAAEVLKAGGSVVAIMVSRLLSAIVLKEQWPIQQQGGPIVDVYKRKGDPKVSDNSRGILLSDHMFKAELSIVMESLLPVYHSRMPATQMGAVAGGGTDFRTHMFQSAIETAKLEGGQSWSFCGPCQGL